MIRFVATAEEALAAHAGTLTEIRRPVERAHVSGVATAVHCDGSGNGWIAWFGAPPREETTRRLYPGPPGKSGFPCPLGAPGDLMFVGEAWRSWAEEGEEPDDDGHGARCWRQTYVAYEATPRRGLRTEPYREAVTFLDDSSPLCWNPRLSGPWEAAVAMPEWAARTTLRNLGVRVERVGDVWTWVVAVETVMKDGKPVRPAEAGR